MVKLIWFFINSIISLLYRWVLFQLIIVIFSLCLLTIILFIIILVFRINLLFYLFIIRILIKTIESLFWLWWALITLMVRVIIKISMSSMLVSFIFILSLIFILFINRSIRFCNCICRLWGFYLWVIIR